MFEKDLIVFSDTEYASKDAVIESMAKLVADKVTSVEGYADAVKEREAAFCCDGVDLQEVERWRQLLGNDCMVVASAPQWVDFVPISLSKATALRVVLGRLGIDLADVVAFGDGPNDCEVFELVGCPVAVAHADPNIVRSARYVTDMVESSLASILDSPGYEW